MTKAEGGCKGLALPLVFIAFCEEHANSQNPSNASLDEVWLNKVVGLCNEDFSQSFGRCDQEAIAVEDVAISYETVIRYLIYPLARWNARGLSDNLRPLAHEEGIITGFG